MGCPTILKAFQDSLNKSEMNNSDQFLVASNGTIYNVTFGDIITQMGLTGALEGANGGGATPLLAGTAPDYVIRGLVGGNGISVQQNISGSVTINANFQNSGGATDGQALIPNNQTDPIKLKRIKAGAGINITSSANSITVTNTQVGAASNVVVVSKLSDFPTASGGVITLDSDTNYFLSNSISTSNRFVFGANTTISSSDPFVTTLTYTGTGDMFTFTSGQSGIKEISLRCANGTLLNTSAVTAGNLLLRFVQIFEVKNLGSIDSNTIGIYDIFIALITGDGFSLGSVINRRINMRNIIVLNTTDPAMTFISLNGATFSAFNMESISFLNTTAGQTFMSGTASGANITAGSIGFVSKVSIVGDMDGLATITSGDAGWDFTDNNKIQETDPHAVCNLDAPTTSTITTISVPVQASGTFTDQGSQQYEISAAGTVTYKGRRDEFARIDTTIGLEPVSGTNKLLFAQIALNGTVVAATKIQRNCSSGSPAVISIDWGLQLETDDVISIFVGNDTGTTDVIVNQLLLRVS